MMRAAHQIVFVALALVRICPEVLGFSVSSGVRLLTRAAAVAQVLPSGATM